MHLSLNSFTSTSQAPLGMQINGNFKVAYNREYLYGYLIFSGVLDVL
jgi:hypothetical protein